MDYSLDEIYEDIKEHRIDCEENVRDTLLQSLIAYGTKKEGNRYVWSDKNPLQVVFEICVDIQIALDEGVKNNGEKATEPELDILRTLYVRMYILKRYIRNILNEENGDS